jgi:hypothetical protein
VLRDRDRELMADRRSPRREADRPPHYVELLEELVVDVEEHTFRGIALVVLPRGEGMRAGSTHDGDRASPTS